MEHAVELTEAIRLVATDVVPEDAIVAQPAEFVGAAWRSEQGAHLSGVARVFGMDAWVTRHLVVGAHKYTPVRDYWAGFGFPADSGRLLSTS